MAPVGDPAFPSLSAHKLMWLGDLPGMVFLPGQVGGAAVLESRRRCDCTWPQGSCFCPGIKGVALLRNVGNALPELSLQPWAVTGSCPRPTHGGDTVPRPQDVPHLLGTCLGTGCAKKIKEWRFLGRSPMSSAPLGSLDAFRPLQEVPPSPGWLLHQKSSSKQPRNV